jgi:hypothetical protein
MTTEDQGPPPKVEPIATAYAWLAHVQEVVEQAMAHVAVLVPEHDQDQALGQVRARTAAHVHGHGDAPAQRAGHPEGYDPEEGP